MSEAASIISSGRKQSDDRPAVMDCDRLPKAVGSRNSLTRGSYTICWCVLPAKIAHALHKSAIFEVGSGEDTLSPRAIGPCLFAGCSSNRRIDCFFPYFFFSKRVIDIATRYITYIILTTLRLRNRSPPENPARIVVLGRGS
jgi:hypothetical protein